MINRTSRCTLPVAIALTAGLLAVGCSSSAKSASTTPAKAPGSTSAPAPSSTSPAASMSPAASRPAAGVRITIKNFGYTESGPAAAGSTVQVTNNDGEAHTVTADTGMAFDVTIEPGKTASFTAPRKAGSYTFHCNFHSNMHGTLMVTG